MEICGNPGLSFTMVPYLHHNNAYIKRKLRVWRAIKCNFLVVQQPYQLVWACKLPHVMLRRIGPTTEIFWKFGSTYLHVCTKQCVIKRKLRVYRAQKCNFLVGAKTVKGGAGLQTTPCHAAPYRADNENFRKFGSTYRLGTVFPPKQYLHEKEAMGEENPKM